MRTESGVVVD